MTTMSVSTFLKVAQKLPPNTSILLRGDHGIGKSQLVRQVARLIAALRGLGTLPVVDWRLSQCTEGDIIGLPSTDGEVTRFNPPERFKRACTSPHLLFLDELNRATAEVMQAGFQIVLDRELNGWKLHPNTIVMSAVNDSAAYNVNEIDPALLDRFWVVDLMPDTQDWLAWGRAMNENPDPEIVKLKAPFGGRNCLPLIVDFIAQEEKWLDPPKNAEPKEVHVSRRSWERLGDALGYAGLDDKPADPLFYSMCLGYIGVAAAAAFTAYAKTTDNRFTGEEILADYASVRRKVTSKKSSELFNSAIDKVTDLVIKAGNITPHQGKNLSDFMEDLPGELKILLWTKLTAGGVDKLDLAKGVHLYLAKHVLDVFGVPMGEAGIGVIPNIPGIFKPGAVPAKASKTKGS